MPRMTSVERGRRNQRTWAPNLEEWQRRLEDMKIEVKIKQPIRVVGDKIVASRDAVGSEEYFEEVSQELARRGEVPVSFTDQFFVSARRGARIQLASVWSFAVIANADLREFAILETFNDPDQPDEPYQIAPDHRSTINAWAAALICAALLPGIVYALLLLPLDVETLKFLFPAIGLAVCAALAVWAAQPKLQMPNALQFVFGLYFGVVSGAAAYFAAIQFDPNAVQYFSATETVVAGALYVVAATLGFPASYIAARIQRHRGKATLAKRSEVALIGAALVFSVVVVAASALT